jgi:hypothetical protein
MTDVAMFMNALRAAVPAEPDPGLGVDLVPRLAAAARASTIEAETQVMRRRSAQRIGTARRLRLTSVARVAIAIALIPLVLEGLAVAGVTVPSPARSAFESLGISLPNQPGKEQTEGVSGESSESAQPAAAGTAGPSKGAAQSKGKSTAAHHNAVTQRAAAKGKAIGHTRGKAIGLRELTPPGLSGETGPPAHSNAGGSSGSHSRSHTPPPPPTQVPSGSATGHANTPQGDSR